MTIIENDSSPATNHPRVVKVSLADVIAARTRVEADKILGRITPAVIVRVAQVPTGSIA